MTVGPSRGSVVWALGDGPFVPSAHWWFRETAGGLIVHFHDEAEYDLRTGQPAEVRVTLGPADDVQAALGFLLAVIPLALPLFDLEPFHGAALEWSPGSALLVLGHAEAGKSSTAAALRAQGLRFLADDACALDPGGALWPGPPLLGVLELEDPEGAFATYDGKSIVAIDGHNASPRDVGGAVILRPTKGASLEIESLSGRAAVEAFLQQVRAPRVMPDRRERLQFDSAVALARQRVGVATFDKARHEPAEVADTIRTWIEAA
jgi:hypothetical protein